jgi:uncharacterized cupredoxin-like copper-binding protein
MAAAILVLVVPLVVFTGIDRGWFDSSDGGGAAHHPGRLVNVELGNFYITTDAPDLAAGTVTFPARHPGGHAHGAGGEIHELVVAKVGADGTYDVVGSVTEIPPGKHKDLVLTLAPGEYEFQCNVVEMVGGKPVSHYREGMKLRVRVT